MPLPEFMQENTDSHFTPDMMPDSQEDIPLENTSDAATSFWQNLFKRPTWQENLPEVPEWKDVKNLFTSLQTKWNEGTAWTQTKWSDGITWAHSSWENLTLENARNTAAGYIPDSVTQKTNELSDFLDQHLTENQQYALAVGAAVTLASAVIGTTGYLGYKYLKGRQSPVAQPDEENNTEKKTHEEENHSNVNKNTKGKEDKPLLRTSPT